MPLSPTRAERATLGDEPDGRIRARLGCGRVARFLDRGFDLASVGRGFDAYRLSSEAITSRNHDAFLQRFERNAWRLQERTRSGRPTLVACFVSPKTSLASEKLFSRRVDQFAQDLLWR